MPYGWIDPEVFIEHNGMTVYHVYKDDEISQGRREFWYTTDLCGGDCNDPFAFDVRELPTYADGKSHRQVIWEAIDAGILQTPE